MRSHPEEAENVSRPPPAVSDALQLATSNICSPNESSELCFWISTSLSPSFSLNNHSCLGASHQCTGSDLLIFLSQRHGISVHPDLWNQHARTVWIFFFTSLSPTKLSAPSPSRHSSLRTRVHIFSSKALSCTTHSFPVWLSRLTRLTQVWRAGLAPALDAGNH